MRLCLLSGQSRIGDNALTPAQHAFLADAAAEVIDFIDCGIPFFMSAPPLRTAAPLLDASFSNLRQFIWACTDAGYAMRAAVNLQALLDATMERLILFTGSGGLAILNAAWPHLKRGRSQLAILSFGPVGRCPKEDAGVRFEAVQGQRDGWSHALYRGPVAHRPDCGHPDYWRDDVCRAIARQAVLRALERAA